MRKNKQKLFLFSLITLVSLFIGGCSTGGTTTVTKEAQETSKGALETIKEAGKIRIAVFGDKAPFGYIDENGKNQGYDVYLARRIAKDLLGSEEAIEFVIVEAKNRVDVLKANKVDLVLANFTITDERKEQVDFANPYMKVAIGVASPKASLVTTPEELVGEKLIINKGTTAETYFASKYPEIEQEKYDQNTEAFEALKDGRGAALAHDNTLLYAWVKDNPSFEVSIKELGQLDYIAPAVQKGNSELLEWLNEELVTLGSENFFHQAYEETLQTHFSEEIKADDVVVEGQVN